MDLKLSQRDGPKHNLRANTNIYYVVLDASVAVLPLLRVVVVFFRVRVCEMRVGMMIRLGMFLDVRDFLKRF